MSKNVASRIGALPYFLPYIVPALTVVTQYTDKAWHSWIPSLFVWVVVPILDLLIPVAAGTRLTTSQRRALDRRASYSLAVYLWCPTQLGILFWSAHRVCYVPLQLLKLTGLLMSVGLIAAEGINVSHELLHRRRRFERFLAKVLLISVQYGHFTIEHAKGHHFRAATPMDPATLRYGESFYHFLPRTVIGGYRSAWRIECERLRRQKEAVLGPSNEMLLFLGGQALMVVSFGFFFGRWGISLLMCQAVFAILLLEQVNAMEHYGLMRKKKKNGEYEPVGPRHSWDSSRRFSNFIMFKLQLHPDHHLRKYTSTALYSESTVQMLADLQLFHPLMSFFSQKTHRKGIKLLKTQKVVPDFLWDT